MTIGMILLIIVAILILLGVGQRILDRLRLNDKLALLFIALIIGLGFVPDIRITPVFAFNLGGAVIPLALCIYLFIKADTAWERWRCILASLATGAAIFAIGWFAPDEPETITVDPIILYGLAAGLIAYIFGRSRRCAFIAGVIGMMLSNTANAVYVWSKGVEQDFILGGAGAFDGIIVAGLVGVLLAELLGEIIERMKRGTQRPTRIFRNGEFVKEEEVR
ncbi:MAG: DUF1614 domain-containing protein [Clostridia bacterium]|nr:DUF1614 domain-containing protein [Clostridia bacterium]MBP3653624.1 DUF1614 domain-containing protein [Clostridia bacterium]